MTTKQAYLIPSHLHNGWSIFCANGPRDRGRPFDLFRKRVKWPHSDRSWLAERLGCSVDDPKLDLRAVAAAHKGELAIYVNAEDQLGDFGSPKERRKT